MFKLRDYSSCNPLYYLFKFVVPDCMVHGEYDLYLMSNDNWDITEINPDSPKSTSRQTDKTPLEFNGQLLISNGKLVVTSLQKALVIGHDGTMFPFIANAYSEDERIESEAVKEVDVIHTDLLKYKPEWYECASERIEYQSEARNQYTEYDRNR